MAAPSPEELRREYLVNPEVAFLNYGLVWCLPAVLDGYRARHGTRSTGC